MMRNTFTYLLLCCMFIGLSPGALKAQEEPTELYYNGFENNPWTVGLNDGTFGDNNGTNLWTYNAFYDAEDPYPAVPSQRTAEGFDIQNPDQTYLHIYNTGAMQQAGRAITSYDPSAASERFVRIFRSAENFRPICTHNFRELTFSFAWLCEGEEDVAYGEVYYRKGNEDEWKLLTADNERQRFVGQDEWTQATFTNEDFAGADDLQFGFRWVNLENADGSPTLPWCIDDIRLTGQFDEDNLPTLTVTPDSSSICLRDVQQIAITQDFPSCGLGVYQIELSNGEGEFSGQTRSWTGQFFGSDPVFNLTMPDDVPPGDCYRFRVTRTSETPPLELVSEPTECFQIKDCGELIRMRSFPMVSREDQGDELCVGSVVEATLNSYGDFEGINEYRLEISDANGDFSDPLTIGSLTARNPFSTFPDNVQGRGIIEGRIPSDLPPGCGYRARITTESPESESYVYREFCLRQCDIEINEGEDLEVCILGDFQSEEPMTFGIPYDLNRWNNEITYEPGTRISLELLEANHGLDTLIESAATSENRVDATVVSNEDGVLTVRLPAFRNFGNGSAPAPGEYLARVVAEDAAGEVISRSNIIRFSFGLVAEQPEVQVRQGSRLCTGTFNTFFLEESFWGANRNSRYVVEWLNDPRRADDTIETRFANNGLIRLNFDLRNDFVERTLQVRVREISPIDGCVSEWSETIDVEIQDCSEIIAHGPLYDRAGQRTYCAQDDFDVSFTSSGAYEDGNVYRMILYSDSSDFFADEVEIGRLAATQIFRNGSGRITGKLPQDLPVGCEFMIRVEATNPLTGLEPEIFAWGPFCIEQCDIELNGGEAFSICVSETEGETTEVALPYETGRAEEEVEYGDGNVFSLDVLNFNNLTVVARGLATVEATESGEFAFELPSVIELRNDFGLQADVFYYLRVSSTEANNPELGVSQLARFAFGSVSDTLSPELMTEAQLCLGRNHQIRVAVEQGQQPFGNRYVVEWMDEPLPTDTLAVNQNGPGQVILGLNLVGRVNEGATRIRFKEISLNGGCESEWSEPITLELIDCSQIVTVGPALIGDTLTYCRQDHFDVLFTSQGSFQEGNVYRAIVYTDTSEFVVGELTSAEAFAGPTFIVGQLPDNIPPGCGYMVRVESTMPVVDSLQAWGPFCVESCDIELNMANDTSICVSTVEGDTVRFDMPFEINRYNDDIAYDEENVFTLELLNYVTGELLLEDIGSVTGSASGTIVAELPSLAEMRAAFGAQTQIFYSLRVRASNASNPELAYSNKIPFSFGSFSSEPYTFTTLSDNFQEMTDDEIFLCMNTDVATFRTAFYDFDPDKSAFYMFYFVPLDEDLTQDQIDLYKEQIENGQIQPGPILAFDEPGIGNVVINDTSVAFVNWQIAREQQQGFIGDNDYLYVFIRDASNFLGFTEAELPVFQCYSAITNPLKVHVGYPPEASFDEFSESACPGDTLLYSSVTENNEAIPFQTFFEVEPPAEIVEEGEDFVRVYFPEEGQVSVAVTSFSDCGESTDEITVTVGQPDVSVDPPAAEICLGERATLRASGAGAYTWSPSEGLSNTGGAVVQASPETTTTYEVVGANGSCEDAATVTVTVNPAPEQPEITRVDSALLTVPDIYDAYQWYADGEMIDGATSAEHTAQNNGLYTVVVTNEFGCEAESEPVEVDGLTSRSPLTARNNLSVYPNPYTGATRVRYELARERRVTVEVFDIAGAKVATLIDNERQAPGVYETPFSAAEHGAAAGVYLMKVTIGDAAQTIRLVELR